MLFLSTANCNRSKEWEMMRQTWMCAQATECYILSILPCTTSSLPQQHSTAAALPETLYTAPASESAINTWITVWLDCVCAQSTTKDCVMDSSSSGGPSTSSPGADPAGPSVRQSNSDSSDQTLTSAQRKLSLWERFLQKIYSKQEFEAYLLNKDRRKKGTYSWKTSSINYI